MRLVNIERKSATKVIVDQQRHLMERRQIDGLTEYDADREKPLKNVPIPVNRYWIPGTL